MPFPSPGDLPDPRIESQIPSLAFVICRLFNDGHSDCCEMVPHYSFDLHDDFSLASVTFEKHYNDAFILFIKCVKFTPRLKNRLKMCR